MTQRSRTMSGVFGVLLGLGSVGNAFAMSPHPLAVKTFNGIPYMSGGIGVDEREALRHMSKGDNLQLIFAAKNRDYLSDVEVQIADVRGHQVLNAFSRGPWFFTKLPAGKYTIRATTLGQSQRTVVEVPAKGQAQVYLSWNDAILKTPTQSVARRQVAPRSGSASYAP